MIDARPVTVIDERPRQTTFVKDPKALEGSAADFAEPRGADLFRKHEPFREWIDMRCDNGVWPYSKSMMNGPIAPNGCRVRVNNRDNRDVHEAINFMSSDYLGLSSHPRTKAAAVAAIESHGLLSSGSIALCGGTDLSLRLERKVSDLLQLEHVVLFPTGWAAGYVRRADYFSDESRRRRGLRRGRTKDAGSRARRYGGIRGLLGPKDHVVIDMLAHNCLQEGAKSATKNIRFNRHLDVESVRKQLARIRNNDAENAILVVSESLFSMDSDTPDIEGLQRACDDYDAKLFIDCAHDLGCLGPGGTGHIGAQVMTGKVDIVMGSFPKALGSNGGFVAMNSKAAAERFKYYGTSSTFSTAMSPVQAAAIGEALDIVRSEEGQELRDKLMANAVYLRDRLIENGFVVRGEPSAIVAIELSSAGAREACGRLAELGVVVNMVEYPAVARNTAIFRLSIMSAHAREDLDAFVDSLLTATRDV